MARSSESGRDAKGAGREGAGESGAGVRGSAGAHRREGERGASLDRDIQREAQRRGGKSDGKDAASSGWGGKRAVTPPGRDDYPEPPLPEQHQEKPGRESDLEPRPAYDAPHYRGSGKLDGRVALVTGGDSGIGRSVAVLFAREGADVAIVYLSEHEDASETARAVESEGRRALLIPGDVTDPEFCRHAVERTAGELGGLHILVNNAGFQQHASRLEDISDEQWDRTFRTNVYGYFYMARAALAQLGPGGVILNTGSVTGIEGAKELLDYSATKGAIHAFTKSLAQNVLERGIRVNAVAPGPVWTPLNPSDIPAAKVKKFGGQVPMGRPAQPEELAPAYVFLASASDSSYITGEVLPVLGGKTV